MNDHKRSVSKLIRRFTRNEYFGHFVFWALLYVLFLRLHDFTNSIPAGLIEELLNILFFAVIVYFNILYLIPKYLKRHKVFQYVSLLVFSCLLITPIKAVVFLMWNGSDPDISKAFSELSVLQSFFLSSFFLAGASTIYQIINDWVIHQRERQELENRNLKSELNFLKSQINPHFLFNTLNNLYALTLKKSDEAPATVLKLSEMMRYMLYECNEDRVPLYKEVNYLKNYLELEKLRQGENIEIDFELTGEVGNQMIAPLMFIPFIENSFKHGVSNHLSSGYIDIKMTVENTQIKLDVENSKASSMPTGHLNGKKSGGIGLSNIKKRLSLLYPKSYSLDIDDQPNKYKISLNLNLN